MPIQCRVESERPTTSPASARVGSTANRIGASTAAKKKIEPIHRVSDEQPDEAQKGQRSASGKRTMLQRHGYAVHHFAQNLLGLVGALERGSIAGTDHQAVRKGRHDQLLEVIRNAEVAAFQKRHGLRRVIEHQRAARRNSQRQLLVGAGALHDGQRILDQRILHAAPWKPRPAAR